MNTKADSDYDVAVVGLGPVGCLGALLFAAAGLRVVAFEKEQDVYTLPRAVNLDGEIIRALQPLQLADAVAAMMQPIRPGERAGFANSKREWLFGGSAKPLGSNGWQPTNMFDQPELETFLRTQVQQNENVTSYIGYDVSGFEQQADQVTLHASEAHIAISVAASYLVACDGANSPIRKALGIHWKDLGYDQDWLVVDVVMQTPHTLSNEVLQICDPERIHTYVATKDPFRRWEFQLNPGETAEHMLQQHTIQTLLDSWVSRDTYTIRRAAVYQFHAAVAESWRHERVFLAGDAAHQTPPFLGQGMNSGMRDVINLAWKLPLVIEGACSTSLLNTYQEERNGHAHDLVSWAVDMGHLMAHLAAKEAAVRIGAPSPIGQKSSQASGYGQGREQPPIRSGAVLQEQLSNDGLTGYLLSQPVVKTSDGEALRLDYLLGSGFALMSHKTPSLNASSKKIIDDLGIRVVTTAALTPLEGKFPEMLAGHQALLVRPDKVVFGHTTESTPVDLLLSQLKAAIALNPVKADSRKSEAI